MSESHIFDSPQWAFIALLGISALSLPACQSGRPPADTGAAVLVERVNRLEPAVNGPMSVEYHCSGNYVLDRKSVV